MSINLVNFISFQQKIGELNHVQYNFLREKKLLWFDSELGFKVYGRK